jgi:hypothetical protein
MIRIEASSQFSIPAGEQVAATAAGFTANHFGDSRSMVATVCGTIRLGRIFSVHDLAAAP